MVVKFKTLTSLTALVAAASLYGQSPFTTDFEAPAFGVGDLDGQNGWTADTVFNVAASGLDYVKQGVTTIGELMRIVSERAEDETQPPLPDITTAE